MTLKVPIIRRSPGGQGSQFLPDEVPDLKRFRKEEKRKGRARLRFWEREFFEQILELLGYVFVAGSDELFRFKTQKKNHRYEPPASDSFLCSPAPETAMSVEKSFVFNFRAVPIPFYLPVCDRV